MYANGRRSYLVTSVEMLKLAIGVGSLIGGSVIIGDGVAVGVSPPSAGPVNGPAVETITCLGSSSSNIPVLLFKLPTKPLFSAFGSR